MDDDEENNLTREGGILCALCCCRYNYNKWKDEERASLFCIFQNVASDAVGAEGMGGRWLCSKCSSMASSALESKMELEETERGVRRSQFELLRQLRRLEEQVRNFKRRLMEVDQVLQDSSQCVVEGRRSEEMMQFRRKILKVFCDLKTFSDGITISLDHTQIKIEADSGSDNEAGGNDYIPIVEDNHDDDLVPPSPLQIKNDPREEVSATDRLHSEREEDDDEDYEVDDYDCQSDAEYLPDNNKPHSSKSNRPKRAPPKFSATRRKEIEENKRPCNCDICGKSFRNKTDMKSHRWSHLSEEDKAEIESRIPAGRRRGRPPRSKIHQCTICQKILSSKCRLVTHMETHNPERTQKNPELLCDVCGKPFRWTHNLRAHRWTHMNEKEKAEAEKKYIPGKWGQGKPSYNCPTCSKNFSSLANLKSHKETHLPEQQRSRKICENCGKTLTEESFRYHEKVCGIPEEEKKATQKSHICHLCSKLFSSRRYLTIHLREGHDDKREKKFECDVCAKKFFTQKAVKEHYQKVHSDTQTMFPCTKGCGAMLKRERHLKKHESRCTGEVTAECPICSKSVKRWMLGVHIKQAHETKRQPKEGIMCSHCPKIFKHNYQLQEHLSAVAGERRFICGKGCGAGFNFQSSRSRHEKICFGGGTAHGRRPVYVAPPGTMDAEGRGEPSNMVGLQE